MALPVDIRDLVGNPGSSRPVHLSEPVEGLASELARVPEEVPVGADLLLESIVEGLLVSGPISGTMELTCARCLRSFQAPFQLEVQELFAPGAAPGEDEYPLAEDTVDLEPMIRDAVVLAMPFAPLCGPDCLGLCERCGGDRNTGECTCPPATDSRWAALESLVLPDEQERS